MQFISYFNLFNIIGVVAYCDQEATLAMQIYAYYILTKDEPRIEVHILSTNDKG